MVDKRVVLEVDKGVVLVILLVVVDRGAVLVVLLVVVDRGVVLVVLLVGVDRGVEEDSVLLTEVLELSEEVVEVVEGATVELVVSCTVVSILVSVIEMD